MTRYEEGKIVAKNLNASAERIKSILYIEQYDETDPWFDDYDKGYYEELERRLKEEE